MKTKIIYHHFVPEDKVLERLKFLLREITLENDKLIFHLKEEWNEKIGKFEFFIKNKMVTGELQFDHSKVYVKIEIPFYLFFFKRKTEKIILEKMKQILWYDINKKYQFKSV